MRGEEGLTSISLCHLLLWTHAAILASLAPARCSNRRSAKPFPSCFRRRGPFLSCCSSSTLFRFFSLALRLGVFTPAFCLAPHLLFPPLLLLPLLLLCLLCVQASDLIVIASVGVGHGGTWDRVVAHRSGNASVVSSTLPISGSVRIAVTLRLGLVAVADVAAADVRETTQAKGP